MPNNRTPSVKLLGLSQDNLKFELSDTDISMANSLRRIMIAEVPTLAIDLVEFRTNTTCMQDEYIAHRLGLIPLRSVRDMSKWNYNHACDCEENCHKCSVRFSLNCQFNTMDGDEMEQYKSVTTRHLISSDPDVEPVHFSSDDEAQKSYDKGIVIIKLGPGQSLHFEAIAKKGIGKEHTKWSPVCTVALKFDSIVKLNEEILDGYTEEQRMAIVKSCPTNVFKFEETTKSVMVADQAECIFCKECLYTSEDFRKAPEDNLAMSVMHSNDKFTFTVETNGSLTSLELVTMAIQELATKLKRMQVACMQLPLDQIV